MMTWLSKRWWYDDVVVLNTQTNKKRKTKKIAVAILRSSLL